MNPILVFEDSIKRSRHLLDLYDILYDVRKKKVRKDWSDKFKELMHWNKKEEIVRIDGEKQNSILILRGEMKLDREQFKDEYLSELLRSSLVTAVSAMDRYFHDIVVEKLWRLLSDSKKVKNTDLDDILIPITDVKTALNSARTGKERPGTKIKKIAQDQLHKNYTFQGPNSILKASRFLGIKDFWTKVNSGFEQQYRNGDIIDTLNKICRRRNQIVHEGDVIRRIRGTKIAVREMSKKQIVDWLDWIEKFVKTSNDVVESEI